MGGSGINGAASCYLGGVQSIINYFFDSKNKPLPKWLISLYAVAIIALNIWVGGVSFLGILVIVASLTFIMCIGQKNGAKYRFWTIVNMSLWCVYDILSRSFGALVTHIPLLLFTVAGMIIHDRNNK
ncbi:MAG: YgjV family protein [Ruminococcaceae bacterium]|nr:YgjV family protein [Oscillospiraceae bacterium]